MDLLKTDIKKLYRSYLLPSLSAAVVTSIFSFVDMIAIGKGIGPDGAAALSIATPIFGITSFFGLFCGVGNSVYLGKARGEGRMEKANAYFSASLILEIVFTVLVWVVPAVSYVDKMVKYFVVAAWAGSQWHLGLSASCSVGD